MAGMILTLLSYHEYYYTATTILEIETRSPRDLPMLYLFRTLKLATLILELQFLIKKRYFG